MNASNASLKSKVEQEIASLLVDRLENQNIVPSRAAEIASLITSTIASVSSDEQMAKIIPKLDDNFTELSTIVSKYLGIINEEEKQARLSEIRTEIMEYLQNKNG